MKCEQCQRLETQFRESLVLTDRAQTDLRSFFVMHEGCFGVSDLAEYESLSGEERRLVAERDRAYHDLVNHRRRKS